MAVANARALMLYDGLCGFCNASVQWLLKHDAQDRFRFAAQQSAFACEVLQRHGVSAEQQLKDNSVYLVTHLGESDEQLLQRSDVTVQCLFSLGGFWKVCGYALQMVPRIVRDAGYTFIARNRFRLGGRYASCPLPTPAQRAKFLGI